VAETTVELDHAGKRYGRIHALQSIDLTVGSGEIFGLLGPNGAGKTTLIRLLTGSTAPTAGSVKILGQAPRSVRSQIGYMPQAPALYEDLSPRDNLAFFGRAHALSGLHARVEELLEFSQLRERGNDPVYTFSGGMKQRVSLACALMHRPRVLLLDEPTAGVDPRLRAEFWKYFRSLAADGATLLISTHQMDEALLCDRLAVLSDGVMLACETPKDLIHRGRTTVRVWRGAEVQATTVENYRESLPVMLRQYNLDASVTRIEIEQDALDKVILRLIEGRHA
jgi:ABC-2 type transport system ATP-binding protein